ncbi:MAG TPA: hypothetical protein VMD59_23990 [Acidimicrobiales bacterium]|nr:hypothetical protein [Acidimicrobiales bacterium]
MALPEYFDDGARVTGRITLPLHVRWSDPELSYDLDDPHERRMVYEQVLVEGTEDDVRRFVDPDVLLHEFSELVLPPHVRRAWVAWFRRHRGVEPTC